MKKKEHLPIFGIRPFLVAGMAFVAAAVIVVFCYVLKLGTFSGFSAILLTGIGIILSIAGLVIWFIGRCGLKWMITDTLVSKILVRKDWFTPPFDTAAKLRRRLEKVYDLIEFRVVGSMVYFCAIKR